MTEGTPRGLPAPCAKALSALRAGRRTAPASGLNLDICRPRRGMNMNWDRIEGNWKQFKGNVMQQWGKLTDDQLDVIAGRRDLLQGRIQELYGISKEETEKQISDWEKRILESSPPGDTTLRPASK
jgi:uncharacterized protein YjbJ (UPF0337 family)